MSEVPQVIDSQNLLSEAGRLQAIARRLLGDGHLAEDLAQDAWVAALEAQGSAEARARDLPAWRAWLGAVTRNLSARRRQRESMRRNVEFQAARSECDEGVDEVAQRMEVQGRVAEAIAKLDEPYRSALVMRYLDGLDPGQIARRQDITNANARRRVSRALSMLRAELGVAEESDQGLLSGFVGWVSLGLWPGRGLETAGVQPGGALTGGTLSGGTLTAGKLTGGVWGLGGVIMGSKVLMGIAAVVVGAALLFTLGDDEALGGREQPSLPGVPETELALAPEVEEGKASISPATVAVAPVEEVERQSIEVPGTPMAGLMGRVSSSRGVALEGVEVFSARGWGADHDEEPLTTTHQDGSFSLEELGTQGELAFVLHGFTTRVLAIPDEGPMDVTLFGSPQLTGNVRGEGGEPVAPPGMVRIEILPEGEEQPVGFEAAIEEDGSYLLDQLPVGRLTEVWARSKGYEAFEEPQGQELLAEVVTTFDIVLPRGLVVTGVVRDEETKDPIPFAEVWSEGFDYEADNYEPTTVADAEGRFRIEGVRRDENLHGDRILHTVQLSARAPSHVASPLGLYLLQVGENGECEQDIMLARQSCSLRVVLYEPGRDRVAQGVLVWAVDGENNFSFQPSNRRGEVDFEALPAGKFGFVAYRTEREDGEAHASLVYQVVLDVQSHERVELELRRDEGTSIEGQALDSRGSPVANAEVTAHYDLKLGAYRMGLDSETQRTDEQGRYRFEGQRAGHYRIDPPGCSEPGDKKLELAWGERRKGVDFVMGGCMEIRGKVLLGGKDSDEYRVRLTRRGVECVLRTERLEEDGSFAFEDVLEVGYQLLLVRDKEELDRITVVPEQSAPIVLHVP